MLPDPASSNPPPEVPSPQANGTSAPAVVKDARGLPPVLPPSSRHLVQMFVVPGAIVGGVVVLGLVCSGAFSHLFGFGEARTAQGFMERLSDPNTDVRWRAANDLVQVLKRDDELASDPALGLKLAELFNQEVDQIAYEEKALVDRAGKLSERDQNKERSQLKARRDYVRFLSACLASMTLPVGVDALKQMATTTGGDPKAVAMARRHAVWMLANLGENLKRFAKLPQARRDQVVAQLEKEAVGGTPRAQLAERTLQYLQGTKDLGVIAALAQCADADDPDLRKYTAYALAIWEGSPAENAVAEKALLKLSRDDGHGVRILLGDDD